MITIKVKGLEQLQKDLDDLIKHRFPKMLVIALTKTAVKLKEATPPKMIEVFNRPVKWTLDSVYVSSATINRPSASVYFKDYVTKGTAAARYLTTEIHGGQRKLKRYELALQRYGVLPHGYYTVPGQAAKIDSYGNMDRGQIVEILTGVKALEGMAGAVFYGKLGGYKLRKKTTANFFVVKQKHGGLVPGIWERLPDAGAAIRKRKGILTPTGPEARQKGAQSGKFYAVIQGRRVRPVLIFIKGGANYSARFPFYDWAQEFVDKKFPEVFNRIKAETLAYWKNKR